MHPYELPLICPLQLGRETLETRSGWIIVLKSVQGQVGWGDIAPLPGMSTADELQRIAAWDGERVDHSIITPSVRCGLDMAFYNLGDPELVPAPLNDLAASEQAVPVNALLIGELDDMVKQARAAVREGYRTLKIKVGRQDQASEIDMLHELNRQVPDEVVFRLDANRAWTPDHADRYLDVLAEMSVEYVEEPFAEPRASLSWAMRTGVPVALDESLRTMGPADLHAYAGIRAVVLKPTLLGGLVQCAEWAKAARDIGAYPVISAMMESGVGTATLGRFAAALCDPETAVGLDTYRWLAEDVIEPRLSFRDGMLPAENWAWDRYTPVWDPS